MVKQNKKNYEQKYGDLYNPRKAVLSQPQESKVIKQSKELKEKVIKEEPTSRTINVIHKHVHNVNNQQRQANIVKNENNIVSNTEDIIKLLTKLRKESQERRRVLSSISDAANINQSSNVDSIAKNLEQKVQESIKQQKKVAPIVNDQKSELTELKNILLSHKNMIQNLEKRITQSQSKPPVINVRVGGEAQKEKSEAAAMEVKKYKGAMKRYQVLFNKYRKLYMKELSHFKKLKGSCARQRKVTQVAKKALQKHEVESAMKSEDRNATESKRVESAVEATVENVVGNPQAIKAIIKKVRKVPVEQAVESAVESCPKADKSCPSELDIVLKRVSRKEESVIKKITKVEKIISKIMKEQARKKKVEAIKEKLDKERAKKEKEEKARQAKVAAIKAKIEKEKQEKEQAEAKKKEDERLKKVAAIKAQQANDARKNLPEAPTTPGCYVITNDTCTKKTGYNKHKGKWKRDKWGEKYRGAGLNEELCVARSRDHESWCGGAKFTHKFNPQKSLNVEKSVPKAPTTEGCHVFTDDICTKRRGFIRHKGKWYRDKWGEKNKQAGESEDKCVKRAGDLERWCGGAKFMSKFNPKKEEGFENSKPENKFFSKIYLQKLKTILLNTKQQLKEIRKEKVKILGEIANKKREDAAKKAGKIPKPKMSEEDRLRIDAEKEAQDKRAKIQAIELDKKKKTAEDERLALLQKKREERQRKYDEKLRIRRENEIKKRQELKKKAAEELKKQLESKRLVRLAKEQALEKAKLEREQKEAEAAKIKAAEEAKKAEEERKKAAEVAKKAEEARKIAEAEAAKRIEESRKAAAAKKAADEAKKAADELAKKKEAEKEAARKAAEEAKRIAEELQKKAEELAKKKADEASRKAAEEAKLAAEKAAREEAIRKAAEEAARKAEEAKKAAAEEAARKAEEAKKAAAEEAAKKAEAEKQRKIAEAKAAEEERQKQIVAAKKAEEERQKKIAAEKAEAARKKAEEEARLKKVAEEKRKLLVSEINGYLATGSVILLKGNNNNTGYLRSRGSSGTSTNTISSSAEWWVINLGSNKIALYNQIQKKYLRVHSNGKVDLNEHNGPWYHYPTGWKWEQFTYTILDDGRISLKSHHNTYLSVDVSKTLDTRVSVFKENKYSKQQFRIVKLKNISSTYKRPNSQRSVPVVKNGLIGRFVADDFFMGSKKWESSYGNIHSTHGRGNLTIGRHNNNGKVFKAIRYEKGDGIRFPTSLSKPNYTLFVVGKNRRGNGRVIDGTNNNVLHGWWGNRTGVYHQGGWISSKDTKGGSSWHIMAATNNGLAYMDGTRVGKNNHKGKTPAQWTINFGQFHGGEWTKGDIAEMLFYDRHLSESDIQTVSTKLRSKYGIRKFVDCYSKNTAFNYDGNGNSVYLDRHDVNCGNSLISSLQLKRSGNKIRYDYTCCPNPNSAESINRHTPLNDDGGGNTIYFDRHNLECKNGLISKMRLTRGGKSKKIGFAYTCKATGVKECTQHNTGWNDEGQGKNIYLDRHNLKCLMGKSLKRVKLMRNGKGQWRYDYTCCEPGDNTKAPLPTKKVLINGLHHLKNQRKIPGNQIPWSEAEHYTISFWIKTNESTGHWRNIFRWGNHGHHRAPAAWLWCCRNNNKYHYRQRTARCCGTNVWTHGGNDGVDAYNLQNRGFQYHKWNHFLTTVDGRLIKHYINGKYHTGGYLPDNPSQLKGDTMYIPDWTGDHKQTYLQNMWWFDGSVNSRQITEIYDSSKFTGWNNPREIPSTVLIEGQHHLKSQKKIAGNTIPWTDPHHYSIMFWVKTNPTTGHWRSIFRWGNADTNRMPAAWFWCCGNQYKFHYRHSTAASWNDGVNVYSLDSHGFRYDKWNHMTITVSNRTLKFYLNGKQIKSGNLRHDPKSATSHTMHIPGSTVDHEYTWLKKMIWFDGTLTNGEVSSLFNKHKFSGWNNLDWRQNLSAPINDMFKDGNMIALYSHHGYYVGHRGHRQMYQYDKLVQPRDVYQVKRLPGNQVALYSVGAKRYLRANSNNRIDVSGGRVNYSSLPEGWTWERFEIEDVGSGKVALRGYHNKYVRAHSNRWMDQSGVKKRNEKIPNAWTWERFRPIKVTPSQPKARYVRIRSRWWNYLHIREIKVWSGGKVVSHKKPTSGSSQGWSGRNDRVVDGHLPTGWPNSNHTFQNGWWMVDMQKEYPIEKIEIWNRPDCCQSRLHTSQLRLIDSEGYQTWAKSLRGSRYQSYTGMKIYNYDHSHEIGGKNVRNKFISGVKIGHFEASSYSNNKNWKNNVSGQEWAKQWKGSPTVNSHSNGGKTFKAIKFERNDGLRFHPSLSKKAYSVLIVGRNRRQNGRVLNGTSNNVLVGWWGGRTGVFHMGSWQSHTNTGAGNGWCVMSAISDGKCYYNAKKVTVWDRYGRTPKQWTINWGQYHSGEWSQSDIAEVVFYNGLLTDEQMVNESKALCSKYGIQSLAPVIEPAGTSPAINKPIAHFSAEHYTNNRNWKNIVGVKPNAIEWTGNATVQSHSYNGKSFKAIKFERYDGVRFDSIISSPQYTLFVVGRNRRQNGRVIDGTTNNVLHGWWGNRQGVFHQGRWQTHRNQNQRVGTSWGVMGATNNGRQYFNGAKVTTSASNGRTPKQWTINWGQYHSGEWTQSDIGEIIFYNKQLSDDEMRRESDRLCKKYGIVSLKIMDQFTNGRRLRLKTWRNNYVKMVNNGSHVTQGGAGSWEIFTVKALPQFGANCVALYGHHKRYLRSHSGKNHYGDYKINQSGWRSNYNSFPSGWGWERWYIEDLGDGKIALRGWHNRYLRAHSNGWMDTNKEVRALGTKIPDGWGWERFTPVWI